jgi:hypothetical protein
MRARSADTADAVYRQGDATARARRAQPYPHGIGARTGRYPAAPAIASAGTGRTSLRAHVHERHPRRRSGPRDRACCPTTAGVTSPRPHPSATDNFHMGRPGQARSPHSDPTRLAGPPPPPDRSPAGRGREWDARGSAGPSRP